MTLLLLYSFLFGGAVGTLNDIHRLTRIFFGVRYSKKTFERLYTCRLPLVNRSVGELGTGRWQRVFLPVVIFLQDVILWVFAAVGVVILQYYFNYGQFRIYTVACVLLGFLAYYFTVGKLIMLLSEGVVCLLRMATTMILFLITRPFVLFGRLIGNEIKKIWSKIRKALANRRKKVYNKRMKDRTMREAEWGFLADGVSNKGQGAKRKR